MKPEPVTQPCPAPTCGALVVVLKTAWGNDVLVNASDASIARAKGRGLFEPGRHDLTLHSKTCRDPGLRAPGRFIASGQVRHDTQAMPVRDHARESRMASAFMPRRR